MQAAGLRFSRFFSRARAIGSWSVAGRDGGQPMQRPLRVGAHAPVAGV